jgi:hypothetical protein
MLCFGLSIHLVVLGVLLLLRRPGHAEEPPPRPLSPASAGAL